jgi:copper(I)-binding protein
MTPTPHRLRTGLLAGIVGLGLLLAGCGDDDDSDTTEAPAGSEATAGEITVDGAWARTSPMATDRGAVYMVITSPVDDALVGASVPAEVAGTVEIHETVVMTEGTGMGTPADSAVDAMAMTMRPVDKIDLPAGEAVALEPGGYHIMLLDLVAPLETGTTIEVTLTFESGATTTLDVPVQEMAP